MISEWISWARRFMELANSSTDSRLHPSTLFSAPRELRLGLVSAGVLHKGRFSCRLIWAD